MMIEMMVFDLDGTLIDSRLDIANAVNRTLQYFEIAPLPIELISKHVGYGVAPLIHTALIENKIKQPERAAKVFSDFYLKHLIDETKLYDGVVEVLEHFDAMKKLVLTNKSNLFAIPILEKLKIQEHFLRCYGRESFPTMKPDAGPLLAISSEFQIDPNRIVMIGDTEVDIMAGKSAGTKTVAATFGFGDQSSLQAQKPDFYIQKPIELIGLF